MKLGLRESICSNHRKQNVDKLAQLCGRRKPDTTDKSAHESGHLQHLFLLYL